MATPEQQKVDQFRSFIKDLCGTAPAKITADGKWHRFRIEDTRSKSSTPGAYLMHMDEHPVGLFMDWRKEREKFRWTPGTEAGPVDRAEFRRLAQESETKRKANYAKAATNALTFFQKECVAINGASHPYLDRKKIASHGARQGSGKPFGLKDEPCVIIPIRGSDNKALTLQAIRADGERRFWPGSTTEGGYTLIGRDDSQTTIVLCEGFATGATIHEATGWLVVVCLSASNMVRISRWAGHRWPGRAFVVAGDDDWHLLLKEKPQPNEGLEAAIKAARNLGCSYIMPDMQGAVTNGGDDFNDQAAEYGLGDVSQTFLAAFDQPEPERKPAEPDVDPDPVRFDDQRDPGAEPVDQHDFGPEPQRAKLRLLSPSAWAGKPVPQREWRLADLIPMGQATLFTGAGAVGKSLANQQMTTAIAMGMPFLGVKTLPAPALYITCEDDPDELQRRQVSICAMMRVALEATDGRVFLLSLYGELGNSLCTFDADGNMAVTERYEQIIETCRGHGIRHVTLDNTAHLFTGNEINRYEVASFVNLCNRMAREIEGTVVIVGHPNKAGDSYSGSTAWENQVRSRLFMETPKGEDGIVVDPDLRVLRNEKANYAKRDSELRFYWFNGAFILEDELSEEDRKRLADHAAAHHDDQLFLKLLEQLTKEKRHVSHSLNAGNYAPKVMAQMAEARGATKKQFIAAMERLFRDELIATGQALWIGPDRHPVIGIALKEQR